MKRVIMTPHHDIAARTSLGWANSAFHPSGVGYRVPACLAGVKAGCVYLCRVEGNTVIPYDKYSCEMEFHKGQNPLRQFTRIASPQQIRNKWAQAKVRCVVSLPKFHYNDLLSKSWQLPRLLGNASNGFPILCMNAGRLPLASRRSSCRNNAFVVVVIETG